MFKIGFFLFIFCFYLIFISILLIGAVKISDLIIRIKKKKNEKSNS
jgi:hypothetical protein